nr:IclR family transcriptional regulator [Pseudofrankia asymbiotica]
MRDLAAAVGCHRQAAYRVVVTLCELGWIQRVAGTDRYRLTMRAWSVGVRSLVTVDAARGRVRGVLVDLASRYGETADMAVYEAGEVVHVDRADGWQTLTSFTAVGQRAPAYSVAPGKVLLALAGEVEVERVLSGPLVPFTPLTICEPAVLWAELREASAAGYAVNRGEYVPDVGGVAVPVYGADGRPAGAIGFSGPAERILRRRQELVTALFEAVGRPDRPVLVREAAN